MYEYLFHHQQAEEIIGTDVSVNLKSEVGGWCVHMFFSKNTILEIIIRITKTCNI